MSANSTEARGAGEQRRRLAQVPQRGAFSVRRRAEGGRRARRRAQVQVTGRNQLGDALHTLRGFVRIFGDQRAALVQQSARNSFVPLRASRPSQGARQLGAGVHLSRQRDERRAPFLERNGGELWAAGQRVVLL